MSRQPTATLFDRPHNPLFDSHSTDFQHVRGDELKVDDCIYPFNGKVIRLLEKVGESPDGSYVEFYTWKTAQIVTVEKAAYMRDTLYKVQRLASPKPLPQWVLKEWRTLKGHNEYVPA